MTLTGAYERALEASRRAGAALRRGGLTLAAAESCTGGLISALVTDVPGSSEYFLGAVVAYSNDVKVKVLGVPRALIEDRGAVCEETAAAMAGGARRLLGADIGVSATGIAGPGGAVEGKPVGTVFIAVASDRGVSVRRLALRGGRADVRLAAAAEILGEVSAACERIRGGAL